jgi:hypothetical protein
MLTSTPHPLTSSAIPCPRICILTIAGDDPSKTDQFITEGYFSLLASEAAGISGHVGRNRKEPRAVLLIAALRFRTRDRKSDRFACPPERSGVF